jgi:hypothetical protein
MQDGNEYGSIVGCLPTGDVDIVAELQLALKDIENVRGRPCLAYIGNVVAGDGTSGIDATDDLPFAEMVATVPKDATAVDLLLATGGGSAQQVSRFVNCLRSRFEDVDVLVTSFCMSAGTLFALSADRIWMTPRACLGPIDPQVPTTDGRRLVPAQALLVLIQLMQEQGADALEKGTPVPWTAVRILDTLDKKELADVISASNYSRQMAVEFLTRYKFRNWNVKEGSGQPVTPQYRLLRADAIAVALYSHERWKSHGHAISRDVLWAEIQLKIDHPDPIFERVLYRAWALFHWVFDKSPASKIILSQHYRYVRNKTVGGEGKR